MTCIAGYAAPLDALIYTILRISFLVERVKRKFDGNSLNGAIAQLGERLPCTQEVSSSILLSSTIPSGDGLVSEPESKKFKCSVDGRNEFTVLSELVSGIWSEKLFNNLDKQK